MSYYIYGLSDPDQATEPNDLISSLFYVGKGTGDRLHAHIASVLSALKNDVELGKLTNQEKVRRIIAGIEGGNVPRSVKISSGYESENDAYLAESFAIELINSVLVARGLPQLTNIAKGRGRAIMDMEEHNRFVSAEELVLAEMISGSEKASSSLGSLAPALSSHGAASGRDPGAIKAAGSPDQRLGCGIKPYYGDADKVMESAGAEKVFSAIFVKVNSDDFEALEHSPLRVARGGSPRIRFMDEGVPAGVRRGWNPDLPWSPEQAHERAYRYWSISSDRVAQWIAKPASCPRYLVALVPDRGRSVVRYVWRVDPEGVWERYESYKRWGVPVLDPLSPEHSHPLVGKIPLNENGAGFLYGYASGVRVGKFQLP